MRTNVLPTSLHIAPWVISSLVVTCPASLDHAPHGSVVLAAQGYRYHRHYYRARPNTPSMLADVAANHQYFSCRKARWVLSISRRESLLNE